MTHDQTTVDASQASDRPVRAEVTQLGIVQLWRSSEPERVGELLLLPRTQRRQPTVIGRGEACAHWVQQRPGALHETGPLRDPKISRRQLELRKASAGEVHVLNVGRGQLEDPTGAVVTECTVRVGDTFGLDGRALFLLVERPAHIPPLNLVAPETWTRFGEVDQLGFVGESVAMWSLRRAIAQTASQDTHTLVWGPSGTGKELTARALHRLSGRASGPWVAQNAAAIPPGLMAAELFGNCKGYPNPGTPARSGLFGAADGGVLMLDEIGDLPMAAQAALLRVLDAGGDYHRLGESRERHADVRVIGASNQPRHALRSDFSARFLTHLQSPGLTQRREDIPLIGRHLLREAGIERPMGAALVRALVTGSFDTHVRELRATLMRAHDATPRGPLQLPRGGIGSKVPKGIVATSPTVADIREALAAHFGNREATARALGLSSRYALYRLMKVHGIET